MIIPMRPLAPLWLIALTLPVPAVQAQALTIPMCNGGTQRIDLLLDQGPGRRDDHDCCRKACHAGADRRKKSGLLSDNCC